MIEPRAFYTVGNRSVPEWNLRPHPLPHAPCITYSGLIKAPKPPKGQVQNPHQEEAVVLSGAEQKKTAQGLTTTRGQKGAGPGNRSWKPGEKISRGAPLPAPHGVLEDGSHRYLCTGLACPVPVFFKTRRLS